VKHPANHIFSHTPETLGAWCRDVGMPAYRAGQILEWVYAKGVADPDAMTNLGKGDRDLLRSQVTFLSGEVVRHQRATDGTQKLLVEWEDFGSPPEASERRIALMPGADASRQTECVMIPSLDNDERGMASRYTACISSQVGCPVGCRFCASGLGGLDANLSAGRIVEQVWRLSRLEGVRRISNVVFMGMGEPLANLGGVVPAIRTLAAPWGMGISARKITVSTVGLPKAIDKLAEQLELPVTLALSLHAPTDEIRRGLIPWAQYTTIRELLEACTRWFERTGREVTLEYTLLRGVNDQPEHARELARLARTLRANVNLIRYNEVNGVEFERPRDADVRRFQDVLREGGINAHIRASRGRDIAAACGQLRHEHASPGAG